MNFEITTHKTETFVREICSFLELDEEKFLETLKKLRAKGWERWGGGTVEVPVAEMLYCVAVLLDCKKIFEAGTNWGYSTAHLAAAVQDLGGDGYVVSCDIDPHAINEAAKYISEKKLSAYLAVADSTQGGLIRERIDMGFIDSSHKYEPTKLEWAWLAPCLRERGVVLFHDAYTDDYGVKQFLSELKNPVLILPTQLNTGLGIVKVGW